MRGTVPRSSGSGDNATGADAGADAIGADGAERGTGALIVLWYCAATHEANSCGYPRAAARYIFREMPASIAEWVFWIAAIACAVAQAAILRSAVGRQSPVSGATHSPDPDAALAGDDDATAPPPATRRTMSVRALGELVWALLPAIVLALVFLWTWRAMHPSPAALPPTAAAMDARYLAAR